MLNIRQVKSFFNGQDLTYRSRSHTFTDSTISKIFSRIIFDTPLTFNLSNLRTSSVGSREFLEQLRHQFDVPEDSWVKESDKIISSLSTIDNPDAKSTIQKIRDCQNVYKRSIESISSDSPEFIKKDLETATRILATNPECIEFIDPKLLSDHPELYEIACKKDHMLIDKVPKALIMGENNILKSAINGDDERFYFIKGVLSDDILRTKLDVVIDLIDHHPTSLMDLNSSIIKLLPDELLEKTLLHMPSLIAHVPQDYLESKTELCLKVLAKDITIIELIPESVLLENQDTIYEIVGKSHDNIRILPEAIIKNKEFIEKFLPAFIDKIAENPGKEEQCKASLLGFKDANLRIFLISKFVECLNAGTLENLPKWKDTSSTTLLFASAIFETWYPSVEQREAFLNYLTIHKSDFKDGAKRQVLLNLLSDMTSLNSEKKIECVLKIISPIQGEVKKDYLSRTLEAFKTFPLVTQSFSSAQIDAFPDLYFETLKTKIIDLFVRKNLLSVDNRDIFLNTFMKSRIPSAIFAYANNISGLENLERMDMLKKFIKEVSENKFSSERHTNNSYKELLVPTVDGRDRLSLWETGASKTIRLNTPLPTDYIMSDSEDWQDLFLCGTEVKGSCQNVFGSPYNNQGLLGYLLDGKVRMLTLKERADGPIKTRCLIKLIKKPDGNPAILLERGYPLDTSIESKTLKDFAKERAEALGLELYEDDHSRDPQVYLESDKINAAGVEYEDAMYKEDPADTYKVCDGIYRVGAKKIE
jgi:hypothetical protein